jgi:UDP-N-acetylglucosamine 4,6-dehydratase/5-epimerase
VSMFDNSTILVTGATGSWGQTLVTSILKHYDVKRIICFSRGEPAQVFMRRKFNNPKLKFVLGDVRDLEAVRSATKNVDYIFHLAALKHVPVCEENVQILLAQLIL